MKKMKNKNLLTILSMAVLLGGCQKKVDDPALPNEEQTTSFNSPKALKDFQQVNLVGDNNDFAPAHIDATLVNAWGIAFSPTGPAWVTSMIPGISKIYASDGAAARTEVLNPSHESATGGHPTGVIFNSTSDFKLPNGAKAIFIFAQADGVISGWNGGDNAVKQVDHPGELYTGIALATDNGSNFLYAANFSEGKIDVFNPNWEEVNKPFVDPDLPAGYSPFNIQNIGGKLYVMYAKNGINPGEVVSVGRGNGFVSIFNPDGSFVNRFASEEKLNAPWGITKAPSGFWGDADDTQDIILVGNFGDGQINVYNTEGIFQGQLRAHGRTIEIPGLWGIEFAPATSPTFDHNALYFAAGPGGEQHGLFGYIKKTD